MPRKTPEQLIAYYEERARAIKSSLKEKERKERTRRLIKCAATIESVSGVTLDEELSRWLGEQLLSRRAQDAR